MEIIEKVQQQLKRWYTISCILTIIICITLTSIQSVTLIKLQQLPAIQHCVLPDISPKVSGETTKIEHEHTQEIESLIKKQQRFLPMLRASIEALPESLQITKLLIEPTARIEYTGKVIKQVEIIELLNNLQKAGYPEIIKLDIQESFHLILNILA
jgi:hypothetical protein